MLVLFSRGIVPLLSVIIPLLGVIGLAVALYIFGPMIAHRLLFLLKFGKYLMLALGSVGLGLLAVLAKSVIESRRMIFLLGDIAMGKAEQAVGRVSVSRSDDVEDGLDQILRRRTQMYYFVLGEKSFRVSQEAYDELYDTGGRGWFRVYFTPRSHFLLSIEPASGLATVAEAAERAA